MATNRASTSRSLPPPTLSSQSLHAMSTRSSEALARRQSMQQQQQQHQQQQQQHPAPTSSTSASHQQRPGPQGGLPPIEGRLTRKRARSINVEEANYPRVDGLSLHSPGLAGTPPGSATTASAPDLICICPSPPKVPRPRNGMYLFTLLCAIFPDPSPPPPPSDGLFCLPGLSPVPRSPLPIPVWLLASTPETQLGPPRLCCS